MVLNAAERSKCIKHATSLIFEGPDDIGFNLDEGSSMLWKAR